MKKMSFVLAVVVALSMLLAACQPAAAPAAPAPTVAIQQFEPTAAPVQPATAAPTTAAAAPEPTKAPEATAAPAVAEKVADPDAKITVAMETIIENLDFMTNSTLNSAGVFEMMYDRLVNLDEKVTLQPMLATEWTTSEDGKVWTFKLRNDVKFWDGTPLTAKDVKYTVERMQQDAFNVGNTQYLNSQFQFDKAVVVDDFTIEIHTKTPIPALLYTLEEVNILPEAVYSKLTPEEAGSKTIMGSGPFKFVDFKKDDLVTLERNDDYWGQKAQFKTLVYRAIPEPSTRIAELETGGVDVIQGIPMAQADAVNSMANARVEAISNGCRQYLGFNFANPFYQDKKVRLALNHAIDWEAINQAFFKGSAPRMVVHVNKPWLNETLKPYEYDLAKVDSLLTEAGFKKGTDGIYEKDGKKLAPSIMVYYAQTSERYEVLLSLVDQLKKAGIAAEPYYLESSAAFEKLDKRQVDDMFFIGSCTSYEGQGDISDLQKDSGSNYGRWENADFEAMFAELLKEFDLNKRKEILNKMQVLLYEEAPMIPLWIRVDVWGINKNVEWHPNPSGRALMLSAVKYK